MTVESLLGFALAYALAVAVPGPFVAAMVARSMAQGFRVGFAMSLGAGVGDLVWACAALFGLALIAEFIAPALAVLKYAGAAYLVWIGYKLLTSRAETVEAMALDRSTAFSTNFLTGFGICMGNPKPMAFFLAILPGLFVIPDLILAEKLIILAMIPPILMTVLCGWALMATRARHMLTSSRAVQRMNRATGGVMVGAGAAIAAS